MPECAFNIYIYIYIAPLFCIQLCHDFFGGGGESFICLLHGNRKLGGRTKGELASCLDISAVGMGQLASRQEGVPTATWPPATGPGAVY